MIFIILKEYKMEDMKSSAIINLAIMAGMEASYSKKDDGTIVGWVKTDPTEGWGYAAGLNLAAVPRKVVLSEMPKGIEHWNNELALEGIINSHNK